MLDDDTLPPLPQGYEPHELPVDYDGPLFIEGQMRRYGHDCQRSMRPKCDCNMRTRLVGDGCEKCNPEMTIEYLRDQAVELELGLAGAQERIAELEAEAREQARLLGISGSVEARLLARVAELGRDARARQSEQATLAGILRDCDAVLSTIEPENTDEADSLGDLRRAIAYATCPYEDDNALFDVTKHRRVTYVCPVCAASLERQE